MVICIDFDGTIVEHDYPRIGHPIPGAIEWMKKFQQAGAKLILWTIRSDDPDKGTTTLIDAVNYCRHNGVEFYGVNNNPQQKHWSTSRKVYAHLYIDDAAFGCPLVLPTDPHKRSWANWEIIGPTVMALIEEQV